MKILIVEDDPGIVSSLKFFLEDFLDAKCIEAIDIKQAIYFLKNSHVDLILLDYILNDGMADEFIREAKKIYSNPPILLMSASNKASDVANRYGLSYLSKPFELEQLEQAIDIVLNINQQKYY